VYVFRVAELQAKLNDQEVERRSLADSASSPIDDELRDICDASFSSDRPPAFRPPLPPVPPPRPFFGYRYSPGFMPPFYGRRPPPPDQLQSPPPFDAHHGDSYMRESPQPRGISPPVRRQPMDPEYHRAAPPFDNYREEAYMRRSPPARGNSPPYYEGDGYRSPPDFGGGRREERYRRHSPPHPRENSPQWRKGYSRPDHSRTPSDEESSAVPFSATVRSHPTSHHRPYDKDKYREEAYMGRSPPPRGNSPPYCENHDGRRLPPDFGGHRREERYERHSPSREESSGRSHMRSAVLPGEEKHQQSHPSHYTPERNVPVTDGVKSTTH